MSVNKFKWTDKIVRRAIRFIIAFNGKPLAKHFYSYQLLKIDLNKLMLDPEVRPEYRPDLFNSEEHMKKGIRTKKTTYQIPATALSERKTRPKRARKAPKRYSPT